MQIKEARVFNFGKLQNKTFTFDDGINVIYGANEQGKSTLHAFLIGMLFGVEKNRGRAGKEDTYAKYEPWHAPSYYSGALRFRVGSKPFYLERNFYVKEKSEYLRNEADGEELNIAYGDLEMLLGGIGREEFGNTYDIAQAGVLTGQAMTDLLTNYLAEAESGSDGKIHVRLAEKNLLAKKKELLTLEKQLQQEKELKIESQRTKARLLQENVRELQNQIQGFELEQKDLICEYEKRREMKKRNFRLGTISAGLTFVVTLVCLAAIMAHHGNLLIWIGSVVGGIVCLLSAIFAIVAKRAENDETLDHAKGMLAQVKAHLQEKENERINIEEELEELLQPSEKEREIKQDITALELAYTQLDLLAKEYYLEVADRLNAEISKWISLLTNQNYDSARLGDNGKLLILAEGREIAPEALSRGTLEQIYLALRLAAGSVIMQEEELPIFFDETFAMYDDIRLKETLKALAKTQKQIFIFTCQKRECELLEQAQIPYHLICM